MGVIAAAITFMFLNLDALYRPVANCSLVPISVTDESQDQPFAATHCKSKKPFKLLDSVGQVCPHRSQ